MLRATRPRTAHGDARTIATLLADAVQAAPHAPLVSDGATTMTRVELARHARTLEHRLIAAGVDPGDVVAVQMPNRSSTVAALHAVWALGAVPCAITPIYRGAELAVILSAARPAAVLVPRSFGAVDHRAVALAALTSAHWRAPVLEVQLDADAEVEREADRDAAIAGSPVDRGMLPQTGGSPDDIALLMFTSGTTGRPKGVLHTHRTLAVEAQSIADVFALGPDPIFMPSPLGHVTGLLYGIVLPMLTGGSVVLSDRWDPDAAVAAIEGAGCRFTVAATPFLRGLADAYRRRGTPSSLRVFVCGGADIPEDLVRTAHEVMGTVVCRTYGSTEMPTLCIVRPEDPLEVRLATEGRPLGGRARLTHLEQDDPRDAPRGDLEVQGPELFVGYIDPADNETAFTADGWFRTGDLARIMPGGEIAIAGRRKDLIVRGGENISAKEIEDLLLTHPQIDDVAIVGLPDDVMGERACAVVIGAVSLTLAELTSHLETTGIARQKFPEALWHVEAFPRTVSGKVQKFHLRARTLEALERGEVSLRNR